MPIDHITIRGAREHNLKNVTLSIPRDKLVVFTGLSGSGKSSLAFDTIYAEGQRRYVESLSAYARQFLGQMEKPDVDIIEGLSPAISIDQKGTSKNPRSTVGTVTEVYDYLRLLYARVGHPHCPNGHEVQRQTVDQMADQVEKLPKGTRVMVLGPVVKGRKGEYRSLIDDVRKSGFVRVRVDGSLYEIGEKIPMDKNKKHDVDVVVDRIVIGPEQRTRLVDSLETAIRLGNGSVIIAPVDGGDDIPMSQDFMCPIDGISVPEPEPRNFSFNSPHGACPTCTGIGSQLVVFTGLSGSGKSSLAFDTIYAEGQRRYVESLSAYARQFLGQMEKPEVSTPHPPLPPTAGPRFGVDGVEGERRLAGAGNSGDYDQTIARDLEVEALEVMLARTLDSYAIGHRDFLRQKNILRKVWRFTKSPPSVRAAVFRQGLCEWA